MPDIHEIRSELRKRHPDTAGEDGERLAAAWLAKVGWKADFVEQSKDSKSEALRRAGGKRPDFVIDPEGGSTIIMLDAKYHSTNGGTQFTLSVRELNAYEGLIKYMAACFPGHGADLMLMLFPQEDSGRRLLFVGLDEFADGQGTSLRGEPALMIDIRERYRDPELSFDTSDIV